jgi:hypothetical protein
VPLTKNDRRQNRDKGLAACALALWPPFGDDPLMNRRKINEQRRALAENTAKLADPLVPEDAGRLIAAWNDARARRMPMLFAPTIAAALSARHHFLWVHCPACRAVRDVDLRTVKCNHDSAVTALAPEIACGSCRSKAIFPQELLRLSKTSVVEAVRKVCARRVPE